MIMNKKWGLIALVFIILCVIVGVLLETLLPRRESENLYTLQELPESSKWYGNDEIRIFRQYLTFPTMHPNIDYGPTVEFLKQQASNLDLPVSIFYPANKQNPVVVMTWFGSDPTLKSIMLNSHTDVVPVYEEFWAHPPFAADMDEEGRIFARGAQDTKVTGAMYMAAIRALKKEGINQLKRTFHITFVPDEEVGGGYGMAAFVETKEFKALNIVYVLDEGLPSLTKRLTVINDERSTWRIEIVCHGVTGHGSILFENTAGQKISYMISKFMAKRDIELQKTKSLNLTSYGNVTTINLTMLKGGIQGNVIPPELSATFDVRSATTADHDEFEREINRWSDEAGGNITINYSMKDIKAAKTPADDSNPVWVALQNATREFGLEVIAGVFTAGSDMRYLRRLNISAFGFSPLINTPLRAHDHNEFVHADEFLAGINVYKKIILNLGLM